MNRLNINPGDIYGNIEIVKEIEKVGRYRKFDVRCIKCKKENDVFITLLIRISKNIGTGCHCTHKKYTRTAPKKIYKENEIKLKSVWNGMIDRCYNEKNKAYKNYGGRGICVSNQWKNFFKQFYNDMHHTYKIGLSIDRIDTNGNYCKENCRWVSNIENQRNKRNNIIIEGVTLPEFCEKYSLNYKLTVGRLKMNWDLDKIKKYKISTSSKKKDISLYVRKYMLSFKNKTNYIFKKE